MSDIKTMNDNHIKALSDFASLDAELKGLYVQRDNHERSLKDISRLRKEYKADRTKEMYLIMSQNLMRNMKHDEIDKMFKERYDQTKLALEAIKDQIKHREDNYREAVGKILVYIKRVIDPEVMKDIMEE